MPDVQRSTTFLFILLGLCTAVTAAIVGPALYARLMFPGPLEHQESVFLHALWFMQRGGNIYQPPDIHFAGTIYAPLYFWVAEAYSRIAGLSFFSLRMLSWICLALSAVAAQVMIRSLTGHRWLGLFWLPVYLMFFPFHLWIDLGRLEAFFLMLIMAGFASYAVAQTRSAGYWLAGIFFGCAIATKQSAVMLVPFLAYEFYLNRDVWRVGVAAGVTAALIYGAGYAVFGPEMLTWVYTIPSAHKIGNFVIILWQEWMTHSTAAFVALIWAFLFSLQDNSNLKTPVFARILGAGLLVCVLPLLKAGAALGNFSFLSGFVALSIILLCVNARESESGFDAAVVAGIFVLALVNMSMNMPRLSASTPGAADLRNYRALVARVKEAPGNVWVAAQPAVNIAAGKEPFAAIQQISEWDVAGYPFKDKLRRWVREQQITTIIYSPIRPGTFQTSGGPVYARPSGLAGLLPTEVDTRYRAARVMTSPWVRDFDGNNFLDDGYIWFLTKK